MILATERRIWIKRYLDLSYVEIIMILKTSLDRRQLSSNNPPRAPAYAITVKREYITYHTLNWGLRSGNRDEALESRQHLVICRVVGDLVGLGEGG